jgi:hypothetical protein
MRITVRSGLDVEFVGLFSIEGQYHLISKEGIYLKLDPEEVKSFYIEKDIDNSDDTCYN